MAPLRSDITTFLTGLAMGESARWHDGRFWCSDWVAGEILAATADGTVEVVARSTSFPFCFDWLPDGTMVVTSASGLERLEDGRLGPWVDMSGLGVGGWNEVVVDPRGNAYVNAVNFDMSQGVDFEVGSRSGVVALVTPDGDVRRTPNSSVTRPGRRPRGCRSRAARGWPTAGAGGRSRSPGRRGSAGAGAGGAVCGC